MAGPHKMNTTPVQLLSTRGLDSSYRLLEPVLSLAILEPRCPAV